MLLSGCGAPPQVQAPEPPPPPPPEQARPAPVVPVADPAGATVGVGPLVRVGKDPKATLSPNTYQQVIPFGMGALALVGFEQDRFVFGRPSCSLKTPWPETCEGFRIAPWVNPAREKAWPAADESSEVGEYGPLFPSPVPWRKFSPGKRGAYASYLADRDGVPMLQVHHLGADGKIELFFEQPGTPYSEVEVVETRSGHMGIFRELPPPSEQEGRSPYVNASPPLVAIRFVGEKANRSLSEPIKLDIGDIGTDSRATDARFARKMGRRAGHGPVRASALLDDQGQTTDEIVLAWFEAIPPPTKDPEREAQEDGPKPKKRGKAKNQCGRVNRETFDDRWERARPYGDNGCSGRQSRSLADPTVKKRLHLERLSSTGKPLDDRAIDLSSTFAAERTTVDLAPTPGGGVTVNGIAFDKRFQPTGKAASRPLVLTSRTAVSGGSASPPDIPVSQRLYHAAVDPATGEAVVVYYQSDPSDSTRGPLTGVMHATRYGVLGDVRGETQLATPVDGYESPFMGQFGNFAGLPPFAARTRDAWVVLTEGWGFHLVGGSHDGAFLPLPKGCDEGALCQEGTSLLGVTTRGDVASLLGAGKRGPWIAGLDLASLAAGPPRALSPTNGVRPVLTPAGALWQDDGSLAFWTVNEKGDVSLVSPAPPTDDDADAGAKPPKPPRAWLQPVWGDYVVIVSREKSVTATWLKAGKTLDLDPKALTRDDEAQPLAEGSTPVLSGRHWILPDTPGPLIAVSPELKRALQNCPYALPTGPRRLLLACTEPVSDQHPQISVGVRVARY